jgi:tripartite-type tricarboxylate transporter receptor subunit TctC
MKHLAIAVVLFCAHAAFAQTYPTKPVRLIVGFPPGGAVDMVARAVAQELQESLAHPVIVDNRAGANGVIGTQTVAKAPPDGYTIGLGSISTLVLNVHFNSNVGYHPLRDFTPIGSVGEVASAFALHPAVPARSLKHLIALARSQPAGRLMVGSSGVGSLQHLALEILNVASGVRIQHVAYKGTSPALTDVLGGHIDGLVVSLPGVIAPAQTGKLNVVAVTGSQRSSTLPQVPTAKEQGLADLVVANWYGIVGPPNLPPQIVNRLHEAIGRAAASPGLKSKYAAAGVDTRTDASPAAFGKFVGSEFARWEQVITKSGVRIE